MVQAMVTVHYAARICDRKTENNLNLTLNWLICVTTHTHDMAYAMGIIKSDQFFCLFGLYALCGSHRTVFILR